jgi:hypothetical protein
LSKRYGNHPLVSHLVELYLTWVHPAHMLFGKTDSIKRYTPTEGSVGHTSSALDDLICAMAYHSLDTTTPGMIGTHLQESSELAGRFHERCSKTAQALKLTLDDLCAGICYQVRDRIEFRKSPQSCWLFDMCCRPPRTNEQI